MGFPDVVKVMINSCHYVTTLLILAMPCHTTYLLVGLPPNTPPQVDTSNFQWLEDFVQLVLWPNAIW